MHRQLSRRPCKDVNEPQHLMTMGRTKGGGGGRAGNSLPVGDVEGKGGHGKGNNGSTQSPNHTVECAIEGKGDAHQPAQQGCNKTTRKSVLLGTRGSVLANTGHGCLRLSWMSYLHSLESKTKIRRALQMCEVKKCSCVCAHNFVHMRQPVQLCHPTGHQRSKLG